MVPEYEADFPEVAAVTEYVPLPTLENSSFAADSGWGLTVSSNSPEQELAWDFVNYVARTPTTPCKWNLATGTLPALKANAEGDARDELAGRCRRTSSRGSTSWATPSTSAACPTVTGSSTRSSCPTCSTCLNGQTSAEDALAAIEQEANAL